MMHPHSIASCAAGDGNLLSTAAYLLSRSVPNLKLDLLCCNASFGEANQNRCLKLQLGLLWCHVAVPGTLTTYMC